MPFRRRPDSPPMPTCRQVGTPERECADLAEFGGDAARWRGSCRTPIEQNVRVASGRVRISRTPRFGSVLRAPVPTGSRHRRSPPALAASKARISMRPRNALISADEVDRGGTPAILSKPAEPARRCRLSRRSARPSPRSPAPWHSSRPAGRISRPALTEPVGTPTGSAWQLPGQNGTGGKLPTRQDLRVALPRLARRDAGDDLR
jgi:hypothetical protein